jgi:hypothetical protein
MAIDYSISINTLMQLIGMLGGGLIIAIRLESRVGFITKEVAKLADLPVLFARHDERLKNLEK